MGLIDSLRSKYELYRLEQRYTRRDKRTTWVSGAQYVDGEYVYAQPTSGSDYSGKSSVGSPTIGSKESWERGFGASKRASTIKVQEVFRSGKGGDRRSRVF